MPLQFNRSFRTFGKPSTYYVWANSLDKALIELFRGNWYSKKKEAKRHARTYDKALWKVCFSYEKFNVRPNNS